MSYSVSSFATLIEKYPNWQSFRSYLESPEGGSLRVTGEENARFQILRYVKEKSDFTQEHVGWMRSVVWDTQSHRPVSVAPPKAQSNLPLTGESPLNFPFIQDFVDGTMIMIFRTLDGCVEIASRSQLGAQGTFYSSRTFGSLFDDALKSKNLTRETLANLLLAPTVEYPSSFASFVLQHPEHRIVSPIHVPNLVCVHLGKISMTGVVDIVEDPSVWTKSLKEMAPSSYPLSGFKTQSDLHMFVKSLAASRGWFWQGLVLKDGLGHRWRLRSENYMILRNLRGAEALPVDRFLRLRSQKKIIEYLRHYSEERKTFWDYENKFRQRTIDIFQSYGEVHKSHSKNLEEIEWCLRPCVFRLHSFFLEQLQANGEKVRMKHVIEMVNNLPLFEQRRILVESQR
jgi:hypothetical protein